MAIKLYGIPRSRTMRALWMLEELAVPYEQVKVSFINDSRKPEYLRINPNGHIPALQDGDLTLWESLAINLYLARKYDKGLWPRSVEDEGRAFQWSIWAMTELEEPVLTALLHRTFLPEAQRDPKKGADGAERAKTPIKVLDDALAGKEYLAGKSFTVADLNVASVLSWAPLGGVDVSGPNVSAWLARGTSRPAFAKVQQMT
jgi:glutathione S-transferase